MPIFQGLYPEAAEQFFAVCVKAGMLDRYHFCVKVRKRSLLHGAMNDLANLVLYHHLEGMIVFDDDCRPPLDCVERLMAHAEQGRDLVAGVGFMRQYPHSTTVGRFYPEGICLTIDSDSGEIVPKGSYWLDNIEDLPALVQPDFCGFPVAWMSRRLFETVPYPWFGTQDADGGGCTHDVYLCLKAKQHGITPYADTTIRCDHLGDPPWISFENRHIVRAMHTAGDAGLTAAEVAAAVRAAPTKAVSDPLEPLRFPTPPWWQWLFRGKVA